MPPTIHSISNGSSFLPAARELFHQYAAFLRTLPSHACAVPHLDHEIDTLPAPYTTHNGELLLALLDNTPAACIAYRASLTSPSTAEIKRLYVDPAFRGQGLARTLIAETLTRMATRLYTRVILDTDLDHMPAAVALYTSFGFREYGVRQGSIALFELAITYPSSPPS